MSLDTGRFPDLLDHPPDIRLVTVDMDGTLLDPEHAVPESLGPLLPQLRERGVLFCPASGRQYANLAARFADVADDVGFIAENGSYVVLHGRTVSTVTIGRDAAADVVRTVRELASSGVPVGAVLCGIRSAYVERVDPRFLAEADRYYTLLERVDDLLAVDDDVLKVAVFDFGAAADTTAPALERFTGTHQVVVSGRHWVDVMHARVHKGAAVRALQERLGITAAQTMAFGDYLNDLEMLDAADYSFAMSNAHPDVLARARYVAPSNADHGVVRTLRAVLRLEPAGTPSRRAARGSPPTSSPRLGVRPCATDEGTRAGVDARGQGSICSTRCLAGRWDRWNGETVAAAPGRTVKDGTSGSGRTDRPQQKESDDGQVAHQRDQHPGPHRRERPHPGRRRGRRRRRLEVGLTHSTRGRLREVSRRRPSLVGAYVAVVALVATSGLFLVMSGTDWAGVPDPDLLWPVALLALAALVGEVKPLYVSRGGDEPAEAISTSTPFVLALVAVGGVGVAVLVQVVASLTDDLVRRRDVAKAVFNAAQYTLSVLAARAVLCGLTGLPFFGGPVTIEWRQLGPLLAAGVAMGVVNRLLVAGVVSLASGQPLTRILGHDAAFFTATHGVLLCIGAVAANVASSGVAFLALLCAPAVAVYLTTASTIRHAYQASHDSLTGLGNRERLQVQLSGALAATNGDPAAGPGLVLLDLDHFKDINDTLGHPVGDQLLRTVAERLEAALEDATGANRLGGDEFAVVVHGGLAASEALAHRLLATLEEPMRVGELELFVRASAGVAVAPGHGTDAATLMKNADIALYQAKRERDRTSVYSPDLDANTVERLGVLADLRAALDGGQLSVAYQPQVDLTDRRIVAVEALIRWTHPTRGQVPPDRFIPLAENSGLIAQLTTYVLDTALRDLARWHADGHRLRMAVNLSARHLSDLLLPQQIAGALARHGIAPVDLALEVTETAILSDPARADDVIAALRDLGVSIAVDDYGTGHASLSYLKRLEVDELKVDRSFVSDMGRDRHDFVIVRSTVTLARDLGLRVVAEGIEDEATALSLRDLGCGIGQGYHLGRPTTPGRIGALLRAERSRTTTDRRTDR